MRPFTFIALSLLVVACKPKDRIQALSSEKAKAESVYLTHDENDNPVAVWTERDGDRLNLYYAISGDQGNTFMNIIMLPLSSDVATHAEGMPKVAFRKDGTIIAAYEKKSPTETNKYAGSIYYRTSSDKGQTWTSESFLHSDTIAGRSRSYFDIERLPDGEVGASWLDIKLNNETGGRSVRFAKTNGLRFASEILVDSSACQCCRIDVYSDLGGRINVAYRGLMKGKMGQPVRDMMIATSSNNGDSFTTPIKISQDNWVIDGCPHTGPTLCSSKGGVYSMWYTEGNGTGLYYSFKQTGADNFGKRELISNAGRHPQVSADETRFVMVWEEALDGNTDKATSIVCQISNDNQVTKQSITPGTSNAYAPVVTQTKNGFLVAFLMDTESGVRMFTAKL
ncbi:sialidase family protein [Chryseolinea sp. T2]|uniref:sialidase family protein n=1 Tax=Chryseolinea sp. T2 TaxID=3129255 RepID=UPI0030774307